jgi:hypothetical protein
MNHDGSNVQLYNIITDKYETTILAPGQPTRTQQLKNKLQAWWQSLPKLK